MPRTLVVYYSLSGNTRLLAGTLAAELDADLEIIEDVVNRGNGLQSPRSAFEGLLGLKTKIVEPRYDPGDYDLVVIGSPNWMTRLSSPVRTYINQHHGSFKRVAFFCTQGVLGGRRVLGNMARVSGQQPIARMVISELKLNTPDVDEEIEQFIKEIRKD